MGARRPAVGLRARGARGAPLQERGNPPFVFQDGNPGQQQDDATVVVKQTTG